MTKTKFKVGDEVRIVKNILESPSTKIGSVETVREVRPNKDRQYRIASGWFYAEELESLTKKKPSKPKVKRVSDVVLQEIEKKIWLLTSVTGLTILMEGMVTDSIIQLRDKTINDLKELFNSLPTKKPKVERGETMKKK